MDWSWLSVWHVMIQDRYAKHCERWGRTELLLDFQTANGKEISPCPNVHAITVFFFVIIHWSSEIMKWVCLIFNLMLPYTTLDLSGFGFDMVCIILIKTWLSVALPNCTEWM